MLLHINGVPLGVVAPQFGGDTAQFVTPLLKVGNSEVSREVTCSRSLKLLTPAAVLSRFFSEQYLMKVKHYRIATGGGLTAVPGTTEKKPFGS